MILIIVNKIISIKIERKVNRFLIKPCFFGAEFNPSPGFQEWQRLPERNFTHVKNLTHAIAYLWIECNSHLRINCHVDTTLKSQPFSHLKIHFVLDSAEVVAGWSLDGSEKDVM